RRRRLPRPPTRGCGTSARSARPAAHRSARDGRRSSWRRASCRRPPEPSGSAHPKDPAPSCPLCLVWSMWPLWLEHTAHRVGGGRSRCPGSGSGAWHPGGMKFLAAFRSSRRQPWLQVAKSAVATIVAWLLAGWAVPGPLPVFAAIAALLVVQPSLNQSIAKAVERSVGVVAGVVIASALSLVFGQATWVVLLAVVAALAVAWLLRMTTGTSNQVAISALLVLALGAATPDYAVDRVIETVIGAVIGFVVNLVFVPPVALAPAQRAIDALGTEV